MQILHKLAVLLTGLGCLSIFLEMPGNSSQAIRRAIAGFMRPLARVLLRHGVGYDVFAEVAKRSFVEVATHEFGVRGRPTNISRTAVLTGLSRKEVRLIRAERSTEYRIPRSDGNNILADILHRWHTNRLFVDSRGIPRVLPFSGSGCSFSELVRGLAGDIPPGALRAELKRVGAVEETRDGDLCVIRRDVVPADSEARLLEGLEYGLAPLATTIAFNADPESGTRRRFQRVIHSEVIRPECEMMVQEEIVSSLTKFSEKLDDSLARYESPDSSGESKELLDLGVGMYFFVREKKTPSRRD